MGCGSRGDIRYISQIFYSIGEMHLREMSLGYSSDALSSEVFLTGRGKFAHLPDATSAGRLTDLMSTKLSGSRGDIRYISQIFYSIGEMHLREMSLGYSSDALSSEVFLTGRGKFAHLPDATSAGRLNIFLESKSIAGSQNHRPLRNTPKVSESLMIPKDIFLQMHLPL